MLIANEKIKLRKPVCINDLPLQKIFFDRRLVYMILDAIGVRTAKRLEIDRDGGPKIDKSIADQIEKELGIRIDKPRPVGELVMKGEDSITINGKTLEKPFVEKPVSGEDHNVYIYFSKKKNGVTGARKLFRKVFISLISYNTITGNESRSEINPVNTIPV